MASSMRMVTSKPFSRTVREVLLVDVLGHDGSIDLVFDRPAVHAVAVLEPQASDGRPPISEPKDGDVCHDDRMNGARWRLKRNPAKGR